jgi:hypothetical protein
MMVVVLGPSHQSAARKPPPPGSASRVSAFSWETATYSGFRHDGSEHEEALVCPQPGSSSRGQKERGGRFEKRVPRMPAARRRLSSASINCVRYATLWNNLQLTVPRHFTVPGNVVYCEPAAGRGGQHMAPTFGMGGRSGPVAALIDRICGTSRPREKRGQVAAFRNDRRQTIGC